MINTDAEEHLRKLTHEQVLGCLSDFTAIILKSIDPADRAAVLSAATDQPVYIPYYEKFKFDMDKIYARLQQQEHEAKRRLRIQVNKNQEVEDINEIKKSLERLKSQFPGTFSRTKIDINELNAALLKETEDTLVSNDQVLLKINLLHDRIEKTLRQSAQFFTWLAEQPLTRNDFQKPDSDSVDYTVFSDQSSFLNIMHQESM